MPARSIRWPPACCRSRSARRPRPCPMCRTAPRSIASPSPGARSARPTISKAPVTQASDAAPDRGRHPRRCCRTTPASSCRRRRSSRPSRSPASAPMTWRAKARRSRSRRARSRSAGSTSSSTTPTHTVFEVECGKGTYVRSLARDMGRDLGCFGHIAELRRVEVEPFTPEDFVTIAELEAARRREATPSRCADEAIDGADADFDAIDALLVDTLAALDCLPQVALSDDAAHKIRLGNPVIIRGRDAPVEAEEACATARGKLVAIGAIEAGHVQAEAGLCRLTRLVHGRDSWSDTWQSRDGPSGRRVSDAPSAGRRFAGHADRRSRGAAQRAQADADRAGRHRDHRQCQLDDVDAHCDQLAADLAGLRRPRRCRR